MKKTFVSVIGILIVLALFSGCGRAVRSGSGDSASDPVKSTATSTAKANGEPATTPEPDSAPSAVPDMMGDAEKQIDEMGGDFNVGEMGTDLPLPDAFPKDIAPLPEKYSVIVENDNLSDPDMAGNYFIGITILCDSTYDEVYKFYQDKLKDKDGYKEDHFGELPTIDAVVENYSLAFMFMKGTGDNEGKGIVDISVRMPEDYKSESAAEGASDTGMLWPSENMPDVPELAGNIKSIVIGDAVSLEMTVDGMDTILKYVEDLKAAGFTSPSYPAEDADYVEFTARKDSAYINFIFDNTGNSVSIEYGVF